MYSYCIESYKPWCGVYGVPVIANILAFRGANVRFVYSMQKIERGFIMPQKTAGCILCCASKCMRDFCMLMIILPLVEQARVSVKDDHMYDSVLT